jgi:hypothetical protein
LVGVVVIQGGCGFVGAVLDEEEGGVHDEEIGFLDVIEHFFELDDDGGVEGYTFSGGIVVKSPY